MRFEPKNILITGSPGCGKTTLFRKLAQRFQEDHPVGFYTEEIRDRGVRQGFRLTGLNGAVGLLAHVTLNTGYRVGKYGVDVAGFDKFLEAVDLFHPQAGLIMIDEIGKMECFSHPFITAVLQLLDKSIPVVATIAVKGGGFISEVKDRDDVEIWQVNKVNRDELPRQLAQAVSLLAGQ